MFDGWTAAALDHALAPAFTHHWSVSYNKRARGSRVNGARHLTLSAPISAQRGAALTRARRSALLHSLRAQRFLFSDVLFPDVAHVIVILILGHPYQNDRFRHETFASYIQPIFHFTPTTSVSFQNEWSPNVLPETWSTVPKCIWLMPKAKRWFFWVK